MSEGKRGGQAEANREIRYRRQIIELNVDVLETLLRKPIWENVGFRNKQIATLKFFVTDTGHVCPKNDPQVALECLAKFVAQKGVAACTYLDFISLNPKFPVDTAIKDLIEASASGAAEQLEEFPRYIPATPIYRRSY